MVNIEAPIEHVGRVADQDEDEEKALEKKQRHEADGARGGGRGAGRGGRGGFAQQNQRQGQGAGTNSNYRTFKLSLTDGVRRVFALEYRRVPVLDLERTPPGTKILVRDVLVRRGVLLLLPQNVQVLGGRVASLIDAHLQTIEYKRKRGCVSKKTKTTTTPSRDSSLCVVLVRRQTGNSRGAANGERNGRPATGVRRRLAIECR
jgi:hypothetical protein